MNQNQDKNGSMSDLWIGIFISIGIYLGALMLIFSMLGLFSFIVALIVYLVVIVWAFNKGKKRMGQGLLIGFAVVILLNAACFGLLITSLSG
ncbi:hypothetical protein [Bacillus massilinigeriensis]|uniref:hypothetical protein n=1 Tax=Bacillus massilionigeriensis TaxID=1805475 RepID=UPI00096B4C5C|nr:hypothetical protein [Bacillus massilionigeriensis]